MWRRLIHEDGCLTSQKWFPAQEQWDNYSEEKEKLEAGPIIQPTRYMNVKKILQIVLNISFHPVYLLPQQEIKATLAQTNKRGQQTAHRNKPESETSKKSNMGLQSMAIAAELRRAEGWGGNNGSNKNQVCVAVKLEKPTCGRGWTAGLGKNCNCHRKTHELAPLSYWRVPVDLLSVTCLFVFRNKRLHTIHLSLSLSKVVHLFPSYS